MLAAILTTACGAVLAGVILLAVVTLVFQARAIWRNVRDGRIAAESTERFIASVRDDQRRTRAAITDLRNTARAYHVHLPDDDEEGS